MLTALLFPALSYLLQPDSHTNTRRLALKERLFIDLNKEEKTILYPEMSQLTTLLPT